MINSTGLRRFSEPNMPCHDIAERREARMLADTTSAGLDATALEQLVVLGVLSKVCALYFENSRSLIDEGRAATEKGDLDAVGKVFHTLKSSSAMVGARQLSQLSNLMEEMANDRNLNECQKLLSRVLDSHEKTVTDLENYLARNQS